MLVGIKAGTHCPQNTCEEQAAKNDTDKSGVFYFVQLNPNSLSKRVKLGFTTNLKGRMQDYRCCNPNLKLLGSWYSEPGWKSLIIRVATNIKDAKHIRGDVYEFKNIDEVVTCINEFMSFVE